MTPVHPLPCTQCGEPVGIAEDVTGYADWGPAVIDSRGVVRPATQHMEFYKGDPIRVRAVCHSEACGHQWTLRRPFEPTAPATP
ncbi:hypothetical protein OG384_14830 [Streptomyces sp. NBC_01324]|uniref:hypothetical protein n=1 Tax=Streptomyces sp. NBC_01324 TaxID=2903826 RepID=UPI002E1128D7|nr:hypothetical protein OG384_14830 [Streptomyces sp. NBC_01324]